MTALIIIGIILAIIAFFYLGYYLWNLSMEKYDHNIFGPGVIIRGIASLFCLVFAAILDVGDGSMAVWFIAACILWIWTFLATWMKSSFFIALFSLVYQGLSAILVLQAINKIKRGLG